MAARGRSLRSPGVVYFIKAQTLGLIKIGCAVNVFRRFVALRTGSPDKLEVIGVVRSDDAGRMEETLHKRFAKSRAHGEWFQPTRSLLRYIEEEATSLDEYGRMCILGDNWAKFPVAPEAPSEWDDVLLEIEAPSPEEKRRTVPSIPHNIRDRRAVLAAYKAARGIG